MSVEERIALVHSNDDEQADEDDSAAQQLLSEALSSTSSRPDHDSAARSVGLLNAVRAQKRSTIGHAVRSSPPPYDRPSVESFTTTAMLGVSQVPGKLKRVSTPVMSMNKVRALPPPAARKDVYELPISPEKSRDRTPQVIVGDHKAEVSDEVKKSQTKEQPGNRSESSTQVRSPPLDVTAQTRGRRGAQQAEDVDNDALARPNAKRKITQSEVTMANGEGPKKRPRTRGRPRSTPVAQADEDFEATDAQEVGGEDHKPVSQGRNSKSRPNKVSAAKMPNTTTSPAVQRRTRARAAEEARDLHSGKKVHPVEESTTVPQTEPPKSKAPRKSARASRSKKQSPPLAGQVTNRQDTDEAVDDDQDQAAAEVVIESREQHDDEDQPGHDHDEHQVEGEPDDAEDVSDRYEDEQSNSRVTRSSHSSNLAQIFNFLDSGQRKGKCSTQDGKKIRKSCAAACKAINDGELDMEQLATVCDQIAAMLARLQRYTYTDERRELKTDAYAFVFCSLGVLLQVVYVHLQAHCGNPSQSIEALRILTPFVQSILVLKSTIANWNVSITSRFRGDRIVKDVDENFTVPLRKLEAEYRTALASLEKLEKSRQLRRDFESSQKQRLEAEERTREAEDVLKKWKKWWWQLNVKRLQCETDLTRRRHLTPQELRLAVEDDDGLAEVDANGMPFERENLFNHPTSKAKQEHLIARPLPPQAREWSEAELAALYDGLQRFANTRGVDGDISGVFENIFQRYCRAPSGVLRDFSVAEITEEAARFKQLMIAKFESEGWAQKEWILNIPVLP